MHIYAYFMPAPPKKPKTAFDWVAAAVATDKNELRQYLRFVRIFDNGDRVATDGKRLHLDRGTGDAPGWYAPNGSVTAAPWEGCEYPDYQVPVSRTFSADRSVTTEDQARWERFPNVGPNGKRVAVRVAELSLGDGLYLDDRYLQAALQGFSVPVIHYDSATPDNGVAITEYGDTPQDARRIAVIMPFRL
ncbi:hypothetical protein [Halorhodospira halophila]|uniref:hypothetical protein n=1 Tax=Halorhodospira halophila TaxID=1053 RepID=UPI0019132180|nr:hypothetical protein [Halorhodospira halophila]